jgi:type II secretory pathway pseudopilin PulG
MYNSTRKKWGLALSLRSACPRFFQSPVGSSGRSKRAAFTLVEMLVSMALILFIMVILSTAFTTGLQVFRQLKGLGDMEEHLRAAVQIMRRDLSAYHFENTRKLSDLLFWDPTTGGPPQQGFFRIWHSPATTTEGLDGDSLPSFRSTGDMLHFTSKLSGQGIGDFATSNVPTALTTLVAGSGDSRYQQTGQFRGRWFEVVYFLAPNGLAAAGTGVPLFTLYRRQLGILDTPGNINPTLASQLTSISVVNGANGAGGVPGWMDFSEISCKKSGDIAALRDPVSGVYPDTVRFSSPTDLTMPIRRFGMLPGNSVELAGLPTKPLLPAANPFPLAGRTYPVLGEVPTAPSTWATPAALSGPTFYGNPPSWQGNANLQGADLLLSDVISGEVKVLVPNATDFADITPTAMRNPIFQSGNVGVFDTWSSMNDGVFDYSNSTSTTATPSAITVPLATSIQALKITIRIWDAKTLQARQITIIQDM